MDIDPPVAPPSNITLLTILKTQETVATQPMEMGAETVPPLTKTEEAKEENVKVLEQPGIEPGTIRYLDWMLYH